MVTELISCFKLKLFQIFPNICSKRKVLRLQRNKVYCSPERNMRIKFPWLEYLLKKTMKYTENQVCEF